MQDKKLASFTLMELMVTMFISAILIGMSYFLFRTINFYFQRLDQNAEIVTERQLMRLVLRKDWESADSIHKNLEGLQFFKDQKTFQWSSIEDSLVRISDSQRQGFKTGIALIETSEHEDLLLVDFLKLSFSHYDNESFEFWKEYPLTYLVR